jgi:formylglycine-generating enzyme required for sulfatase activity
MNWLKRLYGVLAKSSNSQNATMDAKETSSSPPTVRTCSPQAAPAGTNNSDAPPFRPVAAKPCPKPLSGMAFVAIPGGTFMMGSERAIQAGPVHKVEVAPFFLMTTQVTQGMWKELLGSAPTSWFPGDDLPLDQASWDDAQEFIRSLNLCYPGKGYRLPSEAEWEYACRAGKTTNYHTGNSESDLARAGWYNGNSANSTHPVRQKSPNAWGLYDMHGNVWEWCEDWYHTTAYEGAPANSRPWVVPVGTRRILRGGSCSNSHPHQCSAFNRISCEPGRSDNYSGFRVVSSVSD